MYKFIAANSPLQGGMTMVHMNFKEAEREAAYDRKRILLQEQARRLKLFEFNYPVYNQQKEDAEAYLHARIRTCDDQGNCVYTDPSPDEIQRRKVYLENVNKQFGPLWAEYFMSRPYSEKEKARLRVEGIADADALQNIKTQRARDILVIQEKYNKTGVHPGILLDDF